MPRDPLIGLVGKPSSGKSTMLNSLTDASSKVGEPSSIYRLLSALREYHWVQVLTCDNVRKLSVRLFAYPSRPFGYD